MAHLQWHAGGQVEFGCHRGQVAPVVFVSQLRSRGTRFPSQFGGSALVERRLTGWHEDQEPQVVDLGI